MVSLSSFNIKKVSMYLAGLMLLCFLHFSCQVLSASGLYPDGNKDAQGACSSGVDIRPTTTGCVRVGAIAIAGVDESGQDSDIKVMAENKSVCQFGQDAAAFNVQESKAILAVADGVGGAWGDSATLSRELIGQIIEPSNPESTEEEIDSACKEICPDWLKKCLEAEKERNEKELKEGKLTEDEYKLSQENNNGVPYALNWAATTFNLVKIDYHAGKCVVVNIGDSSMMLLRKDKDGYEDPYKSEETMHGENWPCAISMRVNKKEYEEYKKRKAVMGSGQAEYPCAEYTKDRCASLSFEIQQEDIVIMGTDGLSDNVSSKKIRTTVSDTVVGCDPSKKSIQEIARDIARALTVKAYENSKTPRGKPDDITVLVAILK